MFSPELPQYFFWTTEDIEKFPELPRPVEIWELKEGESRKVRILRYGLFKDYISPPFYPPGVKKLTLTLRIFVDPDYKKIGPPYWDMHQAHLISALKPLLDIPGIDKYVFTISWVGSGSAARPEIKMEKIIF